MKKFVTVTTLTAGLGASFVATSGQDAQAAEYNYNYDTTQASYNYTGHNDYANTTPVNSGTSGNLYTAGQCTWYVFDKVDGNIGSTWGNANNWANAAASAGHTVNNTPEAGSILQTSEGAFGHVAYVESVNEDGSVTVSEMNYAGGPFNTTTRTISAGEAGSYNYIHI